MAGTSTPEFTAADGDAVTDILCRVCLEPWDGPVEVTLCAHIFCGKCLARLKNCPECRGPITSTKPPNRLLTNMANDAKVRCTTCSWSGTREESRRHTSCQNAAALPQQQQPRQPVQPVRRQQPQQLYSPQQHQPQQRPKHEQQRPWQEYEMSQEEYDHIMCVFMTFDVDGSGELDRNELKRLCRYLNYARAGAQVDQMFAETDTDRSGTLSLHEFCTWLSRHCPYPAVLNGLSRTEHEEVLFAFNSLDRSRDGRLSERDFATLLMQQGITTSATNASHVFQQLDTDRDGRVTLGEYLSYRSTVRPGANTAPLEQARVMLVDQPPPQNSVPASATYRRYPVFRPAAPRAVPLPKELPPVLPHLQQDDGTS